jgi:hypothetical protein
MKVIIAGCRNFHDYAFLVKCMLKANLNITEIVTGKADGVDALGERWAKENKLPIKEFPADWDKYGKSAGPKRNKQMADYADALIALWDYKSKGTLNMIQNAKENGLECFVFRIGE